MCALITTKTSLLLVSRLCDARKTGGGTTLTHSSQLAVLLFVFLPLVLRQVHRRVWKKATMRKREEEKSGRGERWKPSGLILAAEMVGGAGAS